MSLDNCFCFSSISSKFAVAMTNAIGYIFSCKSFSRRSRGCPWVGNCQLLHFEISHKNQVYCSASNDQKQNHHLKIMHFSVKNIFCFFPMNGHARDYPVCELHLNLYIESVEITTASCVEIKEKYRKLPTV